MPVIVVVKLKLVTLPVDEAAVSVNTAGVEAPAFRVVASLFQLNVKTSLAPVLQPEPVMFNVTC